MSQFTGRLTLNCGARASHLLLCSGNQDEKCGDRRSLTGRDSNPLCCHANQWIGGAILYGTRDI